MGEVMVVVARSSRLAEEIVDFLNDRGEFLGKAVGYQWPEAFKWWIRGDRRIENKVTSFTGLARVADRAVFNWAAMKIGRRQRSFPGLLGEGEDFDAGFGVPVPYVRYGDFESWPVLGPEHSHYVRFDSRLQWTRVRGNGVAYYPIHVAYHIAYEHPKYFELLEEARKEVGIESSEISYELWGKVRAVHLRKMRPLCAAMLRPLRNAMTKIDHDWTSR